MSPKGSSDRRFTLADLMVLVVATAVGLALLKPYLAAFKGPGFQFSSRDYMLIEKTYGAWSCINACWMIALLILQYSRPHPSRARLARRPGYVACCVAVVAMGVGCIHEAFRSGFHDPNGMPFSFTALWITISVRNGVAISGAWTLLALCGRWKSDSGWIDRLGRLLGSCWIAWMLFWMIPATLRSKILSPLEGVFQW